MRRMQKHYASFIRLFGFSPNIRHLPTAVKRITGDAASGEKSNEKFSGVHHLFAVEPDVEIPADTIDMSF